MRNSREIVRQKWLLGRAHRAIAESVGVSLGAVSVTLKRASAAGLTWESVQGIEDEELERRLYPHAVAEAERPEPDCVWVHRERHRPGRDAGAFAPRVPGAAPERSAVHDVLRSLPRVAGPSRAGDAAGASGRRQGLRRLLGQERPRIVDAATGEVTDVELFVAVLGASNLTYAEASYTQRGPDWIASHVRALEYFGGAPGGAGARPVEVGRDARVPVRARSAAHLRGAGGALRDDGAAGAPVAPARQGEGRGGGADRAAVAPRAHPRRGVSLAGRAQRASAASCSPT